MLYDFKAVVQKKTIPSVLICKCKVSRIIQQSPLRFDGHVPTDRDTRSATSGSIHFLSIRSEILKKTNGVPGLLCHFPFAWLCETEKAPRSCYSREAIAV